MAHDALIKRAISKEQRNINLKKKLSGPLTIRLYYNFIYFLINIFNR